MTDVKPFTGFTPAPPVATGSTTPPAEVKAPPVFYPAVPKKEAATSKVEDIKASKDKAACLKQIQDILAAHDGMESNIGHPNEYWELLNLYRGMK